MTHANIENYYAARAAEYDQIYLKPERQADLRVIEAWLPGHFAGANVLEVACGTGYWTQFLAPVARHILGIDAAAETLAIARARMPKDKVTLSVGDAYALGNVVGDKVAGTAQRPDAAFAGFWYSHIPKSRRIEFLKGLAAVLAPGAKVVLLDNRFVAGSSSPISETDQQGDTYQVRPLKDGSNHRVLKNFPTEAELQASIAGIGHQGRWTQWSYFWAFEFDNDLKNYP